MDKKKIKSGYVARKLTSRYAAGWTASEFDEERKRNAVDGKSCKGVNGHRFAADRSAGIAVCILCGFELSYEEDH